MQPVPRLTPHALAHAGGRWNHNPSRVQPLIDALIRAGYTVQCVHEPTERSWEEHGNVTIKDASGKVLAVCSKFQHNRDYHERISLIETILAEIGDTLETPKATKAGG